MKTLFTLLSAFLISLQGYSQETVPIHKSEKKIQFNAKAGVSYQGFIGNSYIERKEDLQSFNSKEDQYDGFTKKPTLGFQLGFFVDFKLNKKLHLSSGLLFAQRKNTLVGDSDSVLKYGTPTSIHKIVKYEYRYNNIELPILLTFKWNQLNLHAGVNLILVSFYKAHYSHIPNPYDIEAKKSKTIKSTKLSTTIYPTFQMSYHLNVKKVSLSPFLGIDFGKNKSLYFQTGVIIPLRNNYTKTKKK
jgi:hypothetical protein